MVSKQSSSVMRRSSVGMVSKQSSSVMRRGSMGMMSKQRSSVMRRGSVGMVSKQSSSVMRRGSVGMISKQSSNDHSGNQNHSQTGKQTHKNKIVSENLAQYFLTLSRFGALTVRP